ncbi:unnamed protein product, partial [Timema podura]|nr:unnamed protein product [Timema podura]
MLAYHPNRAIGDKDCNKKRILRLQFNTFSRGWASDPPLYWWIFHTPRPPGVPPWRKILRAPLNRIITSYATPFFLIRRFNGHTPRATLGASVATV